MPYSVDTALQDNYTAYSSMPYSVDMALQDNITAYSSMTYSVDKALQDTLPMAVCPTRLTRRYNTNICLIAAFHGSVFT